MIRLAGGVGQVFFATKGPPALSNQFSQITLRESEQLSLDLLLPVEPQLMWSYWNSFVLAQVQGTEIDIPKLEFTKGQFFPRDQEGHQSRFILMSHHPLGQKTSFPFRGP